MVNFLDSEQKLMDLERIQPQPLILSSTWRIGVVGHNAYFVVRYCSGGLRQYVRRLMDHLTVTERWLSLMWVVCPHHVKVDMLVLKYQQAFVWMLNHKATGVTIVVVSKVIQSWFVLHYWRQTWSAIRNIILPPCTGEGYYWWYSNVLFVGGLCRYWRWMLDIMILAQWLSKDRV